MIIEKVEVLKDFDNKHFIEKLTSSRNILEHNFYRESFIEKHYLKTLYRESFIEKHYKQNVFIENVIIEKNQDNIEKQYYREN